MQPDDPNTPSVSGDSSVMFEGYFIPGLLIFNQIHGQLTIDDEAIRMVGDNGNELFTTSKQEVISIKDDLSQILIATPDKKYKVIFRDAVKGFQRVALLGPLLGTGGRNGIFAVGPQEYGKQVVESLITHGYPASLNKHRSQ